MPGLAVGSAVVDPAGAPYSSIPVDQRTPIESRWGGWYVTGHTGLGRHVGNTVAADPDRPLLLHDDANFNLPSVAGRFDVSGYPTPYSDIAALMVLEHQTHMTNLLVRAGWEFRVAASRAALHAGAVRRTGRAGRRPRAARRGARSRRLPAVHRRGPPDRPHGRHERIRGGVRGARPVRRAGDGRSGRIALDRRLFRYPCSYLIYSAAFDALPPDARAAIYRRMWHVLSGSDRDPRYARLSRRDRQDIADILRDTKPEVAPYFAGRAR